MPGILEHWARLVKAISGVEHCKFLASVSLSSCMWELNVKSALRMADLTVGPRVLAPGTGGNVTKS
jgi:hypothetical protein